MKVKAVRCNAVMEQQSSELGLQGLLSHTTLLIQGGSCMFHKKKKKKKAHHFVRIYESQPPSQSSPSKHLPALEAVNPKENQR